MTGCFSDNIDNVSDLLKILEGVDSTDLAGFLESEHKELLTLRQQTQAYEKALCELKAHLNHVFSSVGGISALPLSNSTRDLLTNTKSQQSHPLSYVNPFAPPNSGVQSSVAVTPISPSFANADRQPRILTPLMGGPLPLQAVRRSSLRPPRGSVFRLQPPPPLSTPTTPLYATKFRFGAQNSSSSSSSSKSNTNSPRIETDNFLTELSSAISSKIDSKKPHSPQINTTTIEVATQTDMCSEYNAADELQETLSKQEADIKNLESELRDRKSQIKTMRKQLKSKVMNQVSEASEYSGFQRTESIMNETPGFWSYLRSRRVSLPKIEKDSLEMPRGFVSTRRGSHQSMPRTIGNRSRLSRIIDTDSDNDDGDDDDSNESYATSSESNEVSPFSENHKKRKPIKYINGWPVYPTSSDDCLSNEDQTKQSADTCADKRSSTVELYIDPSTSELSFNCDHSHDADLGDKQDETTSIESPSNTIPEYHDYRSRGSEPSSIRNRHIAKIDRANKALPEIPVNLHALENDTKLPYNETAELTSYSNSDSQQHPSKTPQLLRSVSKKPKRFYARLSIRLKKGL